MLKRLENLLRSRLLITEVFESSCSYQKTTDVVKVASERTTQLFGSIGRKIGEMKNSPTYRSIEERMGSAYTNVR